MKKYLVLLVALFFSFDLLGKVNFKSQVWPILQKSCLNCHTAQDKHPQNKKPKGGLRLDTPEMIMKGGGNGVILVPFKPADSSFYTLTVLAEDHEDIMPSKGDVLTKTQTVLIKKWIEEGADFGVKLKSIPKPVSRTAVKNRYDAVVGKVSPVNEKLIQYFKTRKFFIEPVKEENPLLKLDLLARDDLLEDDFKNIAKLSKQLVYLNLARTSVNDKNITYLKGMERLIFLHLEKTDISDRSLATLGSITSLEYLNLYSTKITDKGLQSLRKLKNLKKIYLWQTKVTAKGAALLKKALPRVQVNLGN
jgi:hypothetical protein